MLIMINNLFNPLSMREIIIINIYLRYYNILYTVDNYIGNNFRLEIASVVNIYTHHFTSK